MRHFLKSFIRRDYTFALLCVVCYFALMLQSYPISGDDLIFRFSFKSYEGYAPWTYPLNNINDILESNEVAYFHNNGRFLVHVCIQYFLTIGGYLAFYICSSVLFGIFILSMIHLVRRDSKKMLGDGYYILLALVSFVPLMATLCYGTVAMTVNYMWSAAIYSLFLCVYFHIKNDEICYNWWQNIIIFLFALICGSWQESFCIGIAGVLCIYHLIHIKTTRHSLLYLLIGFAIGAAILIFAPSNFARASGGESLAFSQFIYNITQIVKYNIFIIVWILIGVVSVVIDLIREHKIRFIIDNWLYFGSGLIALLFSIFTIYKNVYQGEWQLTILSIWDSLLLVRFIQYYCGNFMNKIAKYMVPIVMLVFLSLYSYTYYNRNTMKKTMDVFTEDFLHNKPDTIYDGTIHDAVMNKIPNHKLLFEKICPIYIDWYDLQIFNRMSRFYTSGSETWGSCILPEPVDSIAMRCTRDGDVVLTSLGYAVTRFDRDSLIDGYDLHIYYESKYPIGKFKDFLRRRNERMLKYNLNELQSVSDEQYTYYIKYIDWWAYHDKIVTRIKVTNE